MESRSDCILTQRLDALILVPLAAGLLMSFPATAQAPAIPAVPRTASAPVAPTTPAPATQNTPSRFVVVLDAAHGGDDGGAQLGETAAEKNVTLSLSVRLRSLLAARGFSVVTTRESNVNVDSDLRAQIANHASAAACVSLHASLTGTGVHLFVSSLSSTSQTRFLAWKTAQSAFVTRSLKLASMVNSALEQSSASSNGDAGPVSLSIPVTLARTSLPGVDSMACPAVAVEMAPIRGDDRNVATGVTDPQYQAQIVEALAAALLEWRTDAQGESHSGGRQP
jgi:N-acetylmuramoyl-L-alanine amidase